jgi:hypothetical protein
MGRLLAIGLAACLAACASPGRAPDPSLAPAFDREGWIADFEQAKSAITEHSPNLEWAVARGMDLPAAEARFRARLAAANDDAAAGSALERFVQGFGDGHMELRWSSSSVTPLDGERPHSTCADLGYRSAGDRRAIATRLPGFMSASSPGAFITAGVIPAAGQRIGILRIPEFAPRAAMCEMALKERGLTPDSPCDQSCADAVADRADTILLDQVARRLKDIAARSPDVLVVDVAGNGGGDDTAVVVARMLSKSEVPAPAMAAVRGAARAKSLGEAIDDLRARSADADGEALAFVTPLIDELEEAQGEADQSCDLSPLWRGAEVGCSNLVHGFFSGGLIATALPERFRNKAWAELVSEPSRFRTERDLWSGPLIVLVDGDTASAAELFTAMLQDAGRAVVLGAPTFGAGCGWWDLPHTDVVLTHSKGRLAIPNCAFFRRDGRNEIDGVEPDALVGLRRTDSDSQRAERVSAKLPQAVAMAMKTAPKPAIRPAIKPAGKPAIKPAIKPGRSRSRAPSS